MKKYILHQWFELVVVELGNRINSAVRGFEYCRAAIVFRQLKNEKISRPKTTWRLNVTWKLYDS